MKLGLVKLGFVIPGAVMAACSAEAGDNSARYKHVLECEMLVAIVGGSHPGLSQEELVRHSESRRAFSEMAGSLGAKLGKTSQEIDEDRATFVAGLQSRVRGSNSDQLQKVIDDSRRCLAES